MVRKEVRSTSCEPAFSVEHIIAFQRYMIHHSGYPEQNNTGKAGDETVGFSPQYTGELLRSEMFPVVAFFVRQWRKPIPLPENASEIMRQAVEKGRRRLSLQSMPMQHRAADHIADHAQLAERKGPERWFRTMRDLPVWTIEPRYITDFIAFVREHGIDPYDESQQGELLSLAIEFYVSEQNKSDKMEANASGKSLIYELMEAYFSVGGYQKFVYEIVMALAPHRQKLNEERFGLMPFGYGDFIELYDEVFLNLLYENPIYAYNFSEAMSGGVVNILYPAISGREEQDREVYSGVWKERAELSKEAVIKTAFRILKELITAHFIEDRTIAVETEQLNEKISYISSVLELFVAGRLQLKPEQVVVIETTLLVLDDVTKSRVVQTLGIIRSTQQNLKEQFVAAGLDESMVNTLFHPGFGEQEEVQTRFDGHEEITGEAKLQGERLLSYLTSDKHLDRDELRIMVAIFDGAVKQTLESDAGNASRVVLCLHILRNIAASYLDGSPYDVWSSLQDRQQYLLPIFAEFFDSQSSTSVLSKLFRVPEAS